MTEQPRQIGGGRRTIGDVAPQLAELTDDVLFEDVWNRTGLAAKGHVPVREVTHADLDVGAEEQGTTTVRATGGATSLQAAARPTLVPVYGGQAETVRTRRAVGS